MKRIIRINWRTRGRLAGFAILALASLSANDHAAARTGLPIATDDHARFDFTAPQAAARAHLGLFFKAVLTENSVSDQGAAVRIAVPLPDGRHELVWVTDFRHDNGQLNGVSARNAARHMQFDQSQIVDWSLVSADGRMYGNYSTRLVLQTVLPAHAQQIASILTEAPTPEEWFR